jgi:hypothetical protein
MSLPKAAVAVPITVVGHRRPKARSVARAMPVVDGHQEVFAKVRFWPTVAGRSLRAMGTKPTVAPLLRGPQAPSRLLLVRDPASHCGTHRFHGSLWLAIHQKVIRVGGALQTMSLPRTYCLRGGNKQRTTEPTLQRCASLKQAQSLGPIEAASADWWSRGRFRYTRTAIGRMLPQAAEQR